MAVTTIDLRPNRRFISVGEPAEQRFYSQNAQTANGTPTVSGASLPILENTSINFKIRIAALQSAGGANDTWFHEFIGVIKNIGGTTTLSTVTELTDHEDAGAVLWSASLAANDSTDALDITLTGEVGKTIEWQIDHYYTEINF